MLVRFTKEQYEYLKKMMIENKPIDIVEEKNKKIGIFITAITKKGALQ
jgi:hypothetical protein